MRRRLPIWSWNRWEIGTTSMASWKLVGGVTDVNLLSSSEWGWKKFRMENEIAVVFLHHPQQEYEAGLPGLHAEVLTQTLTPQGKSLTCLFSTFLVGDSGLRRPFLKLVTIGSNRHADRAVYSWAFFFFC